MKEAVAHLIPYIEAEKLRSGTSARARARSFIATVKGDVHDIGKNIVSVVLQCNNFDVVNLASCAGGENPQTAPRKSPDIIGLSGLIYARSRKLFALEHDRDDVLADVVNVALDCGDDDLALALAGGAGAQLLCLDVRNQVRDRLFHDPSGFHDLRQEHLAGPEQVADDIHALHQRTFDDLDRVRKL